MPRSPFVIMIAMTTFLAIPPYQVWAQEAASDATTPMDKEVGNQLPPTDNTLSNDEVRKLQEDTTSQQQTTGSTVTIGQGAVSGTTAIYAKKSGSAAKSEGTDTGTDTTK